MQKSSLWLGSGAIVSMARRKPLRFLKIRATPPRESTGGSSGWSARVTPASCAVGRTARMKYS